MIFVSLGMSLLLTLLVEVPLATLFKIPVKLAVLLNIFTNPVVVLCYHWGQVLSLHAFLLVILLEVFAILVETYFYKEYHRHPFICSVFLNVLSFSIGLFLQI